VSAPYSTALWAAKGHENHHGVAGNCMLSRRKETRSRRSDVVDEDELWRLEVWRCPRPYRASALTGMSSNPMSLHQSRKAATISGTSDPLGAFSQGLVLPVWPPSLRSLPTTDISLSLVVLALLFTGELVVCFFTPSVYSADGRPLLQTTDALSTHEASGRTAKQGSTLWRSSSWHSYGLPTRSP
jgi:hypothetical protein